MELFRLKHNVFAPFPWIVNLQKSPQFNKRNCYFFEDILLLFSEGNVDKMKVKGQGSKVNISKAKVKKSGTIECSLIKCY